MNVELPSTGCNIINSSTSFYNYSNNNRTRSNYVIYEGKAFLQSVSQSDYGYSYSGTCLRTGDMVFNPQSRVYFTHIAIIFVLLVLFVPIRLFFFKFWRPMK